MEAALAAGDKVAATGRALDAAIAQFDRLDVVLNNAGYGMLGTLEETTMDEFRACVETNFFDTVLVCKAAVPHLRKQGQSHIINVASAGGFRPVQGFSAYCAAKFAVAGLSETLGMELALM